MKSAHPYNYSVNATSLRPQIKSPKRSKIKWTWNQFKKTKLFYQFKTCVVICIWNVYHIFCFVYFLIVHVFILICKVLLIHVLLASLSAQMHLDDRPFSFKQILKSWPCNKSLATSAMFRVPRKCFPAKHGKLDGFWLVPTSCRISYDSTPFRSGSHIIRIQNPPYSTSFEGSLGGSACNGVHIGLMKLILFAEMFEAPGNYIKNSKEQRECWFIVSVNVYHAFCGYVLLITFSLTARELLWTHLSSHFFYPWPVLMCKENL